MLDMADVLTKIATGGWPAFDEGALRAAQAQDEERDREVERAEAAVVARALDNDAGREFLEWLASKTILKPARADDLQIKTVEERALRAERDLGMKQVVLTIYAALAVARGVDPEQKPARKARRKKGRDDDAK